MLRMSSIARDTPVESGVRVASIVVYDDSEPDVSSSYDRTSPGCLPDHFPNRNHTERRRLNFIVLLESRKSEFYDLKSVSSSNLIPLSGNPVDGLLQGGA